MGEPVDWTEIVDQAESEAELAALRRSAWRGTPYGSKAWVRQTAADLNLQHTLRERGRPRKCREEGQDAMHLFD